MTLSYKHSSVFFITIISSLPTYAQNVADDIKENVKDDAIEHITVTSRLKKETLNRVPISVNTLTAEELSLAQVNDIKDIALNMVGFSMENSFGRQNDIPVVRGVSWVPGFGSQKASYFIDGVYFNGSIQSIPTEFIERVEVIKGPQSALYGRSTFSGAINYITKSPSDNVNGGVELTLGENGTQKLSASIANDFGNGLSLQSAISFNDYDGQYHNTLESGPDVGGEETSSAMLALFYKPSANTDISLNYFYNENDDELSPFQFQGPEFNNCYLDTRAYYCGEAKQNLPVSLGGFLNKNDYGLSSKRHFYNIKLDHRFQYFDLSFTSTYTDFDSDYGNDLTYNGYQTVFDFTYFQTFFPSDLLMSAEDWHTIETKNESETSYELRLSSTAYNERIYWMLGAYYWQQDADVTQVITQSSETTNEALMASVSFDVTEQFVLSSEVRIASDTLASDTYNQLKEIPAYSNIDNEFNSTTTRLIAEYLFDDNLLYLTRSEGNSPGFFNDGIGLPASLIKVDEEDLVMYELGYKSSFLNDALYVSFAIFDMDWKRQQITDSYIPENGGFPISYISNKGKTQIQGAELQATLNINEAVSVEFGYSYTNAEFDSAFDSNECIIQSGLPSRECVKQENLIAFGDISGHQLAQAPEQEVHLSVVHQTQLFQNIKLTSRLGMNYDSTRYAHVHNLIETGDRTLVDGQMLFSFNDYWSTKIWGKNLTDDQTPTYILRYIDAQSIAYGDRAFPIAPSRGREFGVTLSYRF